MNLPRNLPIDRLAYGVAALAAMVGVTLFLAPAPDRDVPPFVSPAALPIANIADPSELTTSAANPEATAHRDLHMLTGFFDLSTLPAPPSQMPTRDPAAELKHYRYAGSAAVGDRQKALFDGAGGVRSLEPGDDLAGFKLMRIDRDAATFAKEGIEVALPLHAAQ